MGNPGLYESVALRDVTGPAIRPGGFVLTERAMEICNLPTGATVLDVGCGLGATVHWLKTRHGLKGLGIDGSTKLLSEGQSRCCAFLAAGVAEQLPLQTNSVDAVLCECVLSLLEQPERALEEMRRVLKSKGKLIVTDIYARGSEGAARLRQMSLNCCLKGARSQKEALDLVKKSGFRPLVWEDHSRFLNELAARFVFSFGSMKEFWTLFSPGCDVSALQCALKKARPGYYLMAAERS